MRDFTVKKGVKGYVVIIGCQVAGFSTAADLLVSIGEYVNDPKGTEEKYYNPVPTAPMTTQGACASLQAGSLGNGVGYGLHRQQ